MRGRHLLIAGFGVGGLVAFAVIGLSNWAVLAPQHPTAANVSASPSAPEPTPSALASATPSAPEPTPSALASPAPSGSAGPGHRSGAAMVYDPENHGVLMFGGSTVVPAPDGTNPSVTLGDTWLWSGHKWTQLDVQGPPARSDAMIAYDSVRHVVVLFGGAGPAGIGQGRYFQDTWTWDGRQWHLQNAAHMPDPRMRAAMAFDELRGVTVMFGGEGETTTYNATWTWDGTDWTLLDPASSPSARHFMGMAFDADRGVTVLFGGSLAGQRLNDTWTWDGTNWTKQSTPAPVASGWSQLVYDSTKKQVVAYVYYALDNHPVAEYTITWDGTGWTDRTTAHDPSPRAETGMAYDAAESEAVLYGGSFLDPVPYSEAWTWDGSSWTPRA